MKTSKYNHSHRAFQTGKLGMVLPVMMKETIPGGKYDIDPNFYIKLAPFADAVQGRFQVRTKFIFMDMTLLWSEFYQWYFAKAGFAGVKPSVPITLANDGTDTKLAYYLPIATKNLSANTYTANALPFRAYYRAWWEHYWRPTCRNANWDGLGAASFSTASGSDTTTPRDIQMDHYDASLYTRMAETQQYDTQPNIPSGSFTLNDLRLLKANTLFKEAIGDVVSSAKNLMSKLFGVTSLPVDTSEVIADFVSYLEVNEIMSTAATTDAPLGAVTSVAYASKSIKPMTFKAPNFGYLMCLVSIVPDCNFIDGVQPDFQHQTSNYYMYNPNYVNLGKQPITAQNFLVVGAAPDSSVIGYLPIYERYRQQLNFIGGMFKEDTYKHMILHRDPDELSGVTPSVLTQVDSSEYNYLFAVPAEPHIRLYVNFNMTSELPLPRTMYDEIPMNTNEVGGI